MWNFAVGIYFISLNPTNLQGVAVNGIVLNLAVILFGTAIGVWIDHTPRLSSKQYFYYLSNYFIRFLRSSKSIIFSKFICCFNGCISCYCFI